jgi:hypothetical protein
MSPGVQFYLSPDSKHPSFLDFTASALGALCGVLTAGRSDRAQGEARVGGGGTPDIGAHARWEEVPIPGH